MKLAVIAALIVISGIAPASAATQSGLEQVLTRLMTVLPGAFDSGAQLRAEELSLAPEAIRHVRVHRSFLPIDTPDVGENVLVVTLRDGGPEGEIDLAEFQVWTLTIDRVRGAVEMAPRRFKTPETYVTFPHDAGKFKNLKASDLMPSEGAASCPIYWTPSNGVLRGVSGKPCDGPIRGTMLSWEWTYILSDTALWMSFTGRNDSGEIVFGRQDQLPWRLDKVN
jgi:hypothetical protein